MELNHSVNTEDSEDEYPVIMMREEAGNLLCPLTGMFKIHLYESDIKVHFPRPLLYKQRFPRRLYCSKFLGALFQFPGSIFCHDSEKGASSLV